MGTHRINVLAQNQRFDLARRQISSSAMKELKREGIKHRAQPIDLLPGKSKPLNRQLRERSTGLDTTNTCASSRTPADLMLSRI